MASLSHSWTTIRPPIDLGDPGLAGVEEVDGLADHLACGLVTRFELGPMGPQLVDLGLEICHRRRLTRGHGHGGGGGGGASSRPGRRAPSPNLPPAAPNRARRQEAPVRPVGRGLRYLRGRRQVREGGEPQRRQRRPRPPRAGGAGGSGATAGRAAIGSRPAAGVAPGGGGGGRCRRQPGAHRRRRRRHDGRGRHDVARSRRRRRRDGEPGSGWRAGRRGGVERARPSRAGAAGTNGAPGANGAASTAAVWRSARAARRRRRSSAVTMRPRIPRPAPMAPTRIAVWFQESAVGGSPRPTAMANGCSPGGPADSVYSPGWSILTSRRATPR